MTDTITLTGIVATDPRHIRTSEGLSITSFRLASAQRRFDKGKERWVDADTNWYTITTFRQLAINASTSLRKGERVVISGRLRIREWDNGERKGTAVDIEADSLGHDLAWGSTIFTRTVISSSTPAAQPATDEFPAAQLDSAQSDGDSDGAPSPITPELQSLDAQFAEPDAATPF